MTQSTPERAPCGTCGNEYTVTAAGGMRSHFTDNPAFQAEPDNPDNRKCKGVGQPPATPAGVALAEDMAGGDPQCRLCRHPVQLTGNGRVRSHLTPEQTPRPCPAGSDFPLGVYPDICGTTDGLVATLAFDCEHRDAGACYGCAGVAVPGQLVGDGDGTEPTPEPRETITHTGTNAAVVAAAPSMAEQFRTVETDDFGQPIRECFNCDIVGCTGCGAPPVDDGRPQAVQFMGLPERENVFSPAVQARLDAIVATDTRTPEQKARDARMSELTDKAVKVLQQRTPEQKAETAARMDRTASAALGVPLDPALNHQYTDPSGTVWVHEGPEGSCQSLDCRLLRNCQQCDTDNHRCPGCGTDVPHGTVACTDCDRRVTANKLPPGETEDGRLCHHDDAMFGMDGDRLVCVACGTPCTHPNGFTESDPVEDDGEGLILRCGLCGSVEPEGQDCRGCGHWTFAADGLCKDCKPVGPDPELPGCQHPETHRAGCGCPDDDSKVPMDPGLIVEQVRLRDLDEGDIFVRRGTRMRLAERESSASVLAEALDGPHQGRTGELKNLDEVVERDRVTDRVGTCTRCGRPRDGHAHDMDDWRTPADTLALMSEEIRGMDALRRNCADCNHPITPLVDQFSFDGRAAVVRWVCEPAVQAGKLSCSPEEHECRPDCLVNVGDLEYGDHFVRRGTLMRCTSSGYGLVEAVVLEGPHKGRTGELKHAAEQVERTYCRHSWVEETGPEGGEHPGPGCEYCGTFKVFTEQETTEWQDSSRTTSPRSSAAPARPATTGPVRAPGSKLPTTASAPPASSPSTPVTSSEPTAKASTRDRSAAVTTDQDAAAAAFLGNGRPSAPAVNGAANSADAAAQFLAGGSGAHGEKETKRDRFGRYLIPHPDTGKETAWTRSTTFAKSISDTYALSQWGLRMALLGATVRPDIVQRAHGKHVKADKALLDELTADLKNAAGDKVAANLGTSMHSFTEMADRAWHSPGGPRSVLDQIPPDCRDMVETYIRLLEETGLEPVPHLIEFTTVVKQYGVAGTSDNCYKVTKPLVLKIGRAEVRLAPGEYVIGDKKTGKDLDYGWQEIVIQLATYAHGINTAGAWDRHDEVWEPDPLSRFDEPGTKVRLDAGVVVHLPVDKESEKTPAVYGVDLESGWNAAVLCERVRAWRKVRSLASPVMVSESPQPETFVPQRTAPAVVTQTTVRPPSLMDKARAVTSKSDASAVWKEARDAGESDVEVDKLVAVMHARLRELTEPGG